MGRGSCGASTRQPALLLGDLLRVPRRRWAAAPCAPCRAGRCGCPSRRPPPARSAGPPTAGTARDQPARHGDVDLGLVHGAAVWGRSCRRQAGPDNPRILGWPPGEAPCSVREQDAWRAPVRPGSFEILRRRGRHAGGRVDLEVVGPEARVCGSRRRGPGPRLSARSPRAARGGRARRARSARRRGRRHGRRAAAASWARQAGVLDDVIDDEVVSRGRHRRDASMEAVEEPRPHLADPVERPVRHRGGRGSAPPSTSWSLLKCRKGTSSASCSCRWRASTCPSSRLR